MFFVFPTGVQVRNKSMLDNSGVTTAGQGPQAELQLDSARANLVSVPISLSLLKRHIWHSSNIFLFLLIITPSVPNSESLFDFHVFP